MADGDIINAAKGIKGISEKDFLLLRQLASYKHLQATGQEPVQLPWRQAPQRHNSSHELIGREHVVRLEGVRNRVGLVSKAARLPDNFHGRFPRVNVFLMLLHCQLLHFGQDMLLINVLCQVYVHARDRKSVV